MSSPEDPTTIFGVVVAVLGLLAREAVGLSREKKRDTERDLIVALGEQGADIKGVLEDVRRQMKALHKSQEQQGARHDESHGAIVAALAGLETICEELLRMQRDSNTSDLLHEAITLIREFRSEFNARQG